MEPSARSPGRRKRRLCRVLAIAGAAAAAPAVAHALIQRRLRAPREVGWGRIHRYAGHFGPMVFQELGAGPPVVLLHGFGPGFDSSQWQAVAEALAPRARVLAPDLPGWGRSAPVAPRPELVLASLADFLTGVVWGPAVVVAAGHAAPYAVRLAAAHPALVRALALVAPLGLQAAPAGGDDSDAGSDGDPAGGASARRGERARWSADGGSGTTARTLIGRLLQVPLLRISVIDALTSRAVLGHYLRHHAYAAPERVDAAVLEHHYRVSHLPAHRQALAAYWRGELELPAGAALRQLRIPVWVGLGEAGTVAAGALGAEPAGADAPVPGGTGAGPESLEPPRDLPPGAQVEVLPGCRALPHAERPLVVSNALARFLARLPPPAPTGPT